jgi:hypothetical protein
MANILSVIYDDVKKIMNSWKKDDIYAISFYVCDRDDNPNKPTLTVGYNTMEQALSDYSLSASSPDEAKWNYAFWLQNQEYVFGYDNNTAQLIQDWISNSEISDNEGAITKTFINILTDVSLKLHNDGVIVNVFGKEIPIIIHELEYYDAIALQNKKANPSGAINEFLQWMDDEILNPNLDCHEKMENFGFDLNNPDFDMKKYMDNELKHFHSLVSKMAEEGTIPADRWKEYKSKLNVDCNN